jgi:putative salt-induced outer membrane protein YdiY
MMSGTQTSSHFVPMTFFRKPARFQLFLLLFFILVTPRWAIAQISPKPDGVFRSLFGLSISASEGNTRSATATLTGEGVRQTDVSKWSLLGRLNYARADTGTTASNVALGTQYDQNLMNQEWFGFSKLDYFRDRPANIESRVSAYGGLGKHVIKTEENTWDLSAGVGYSEDRYVEAADVGGDLRSSYGRTELVLIEASNHKLTPNTSARQKFEVYPNMRTRGEYRTVLDLGLAVAITDRMQLTTGLLHRYNSDPGLGLRRSDALFTTGIAVRFD